MTQSGMRSLLALSAAALLGLATTGAAAAEMAPDPGDSSFAAGKKGFSDKEKGEKSERDSRKAMCPAPP